ncbi:hypothetical protein BT96DRAFT_1079630 [Gymnopus androsaceus JB14]|uniref:Uncharacterized protein n=1 Tax=Gymnopus androsaceus JB14 TaxID=1447944 RepID=A0A6A4GQF5_9AGAR|nr:hypothetical protein BT96DRAFT_1079630 [Gymnopus androsaceus JB14]
MARKRKAMEVEALLAFTPSGSLDIANLLRCMRRFYVTCSHHKFNPQASGAPDLVFKIDVQDLLIDMKADSRAIVMHNSSLFSAHEFIYTIAALHYILFATPSARK